MALEKYKAWSLKDKLAGVPSPKVVTNEEIKKQTEKIKKETVEKKQLKSK